MVSDAIDGDVALVTFSHVSFASSAIADMPAITDLVHRAGALVLWDLSHTVGSYPVELDASNVDLAVGCTYKYLNAGPGAPAFLYVNRARQPELRQPIWGWFGQRDQFEMGSAYDPEPGIGQFLVGTSPAIGVAAVDEGVKLLAEAGIGRLRAKGVALTSFLIDCTMRVAAGWGSGRASP
jgi:kynureninase